MKKLGNTQRMQLLVDAYNVMRRLEIANTGQSLKEQREQLALYIAQWKTKTAFKGTIMLVFDGRDEYSHYTDERLQGIRCCYSNTREEADGRIIRMVREADSPERIIVVSDDNYVVNNARALGATIRPVRFLAIEKKTVRTAQKARQTGKRLDPATANAITHEMKKVWGIE